MIQSPASGRRAKYSRNQLAPVLFLTTASILYALHAKAADWSAVSTISQSVEVDDNIELAQESPGNTITSTSTASVGVSANATAYTFNMGGAVTFRQFDGAAAPSNPEPLSESLDAGLVLRWQTYTIGFSGAVSRQGTTFTETTDEFDELGVITVDTDRINYSTGADVSVEINRTNSVSFSGNYRTVDFGDSSDALVPFTDVNFATSWVNQISPRTEGNVAASVSFFDAESVDRSESQTLNVSAGVNTSINQRLSVSGSVGLNAIHSVEGNAGGTLRSTSVGPIFDVGLGYRLGATDVSLSLSQSVSASALGDLQERRSVRFGLNHQINSQEAFGLDTRLTLRESASSQTGGSGSGTTFVSVAPNYSISLDRHWSFNVGYEFRYQDAADGTGMSNQVFGTLSRSFVLLP